MQVIRSCFGFMGARFELLPSRTSSVLKIIKPFDNTNPFHSSNRVRSFTSFTQNTYTSKFLNPATSKQVLPSVALFSLLKLSPDSLAVPIMCSFDRGYKTGSSVKLRCRGCYFIRRKGRLFVECDLKPRHKQMQTMSRYKLWREHYDKGNTRVALHWGWQKRERCYWSGETSQFNFKPCIDYRSGTI